MMRDQVYIFRISCSTLKTAKGQEAAVSFDKVPNV